MGNKSRHRLKFSVLVALVQIYLVTFHFEETILVTTALIASAVFLWWRFDFSKAALRAFIIFAISGYVAEAIVVTNGAWVYADQHFLGLPVWLPILWGTVGMAATVMNKKLAK